MIFTRSEARSISVLEIPALYKRFLIYFLILSSSTRWYAEKDFADYLVEDHEIRTYLKKRLYSAGVSKIEIERASDRVKIIIYTAKPGKIGRAHV